MKRRSNRLSLKSKAPKPDQDRVALAPRTSSGDNSGKPLKREHSECIESDNQKKRKTTLLSFFDRSVTKAELSTKLFTVKESVDSDALAELDSPIPEESEGQSFSRSRQKHFRHPSALVTFPSLVDLPTAASAWKVSLAYGQSLPRRGKGSLKLVGPIIFRFKCREPAAFGDSCSIGFTPQVSMEKHLNGL